VQLPVVREGPGKKSQLCSDFLYSIE